MTALLHENFKLLMLSVLIGSTIVLAHFGQKPDAKTSSNSNG